MAFGAQLREMGVTMHQAATPRSGRRMASKSMAIHGQVVLNGDG
jgi:hypothetical protein